MDSDAVEHTSEKLLYKELLRDREVFSRADNEAQELHKLAKSLSNVSSTEIKLLCNEADKGRPG